MPIQNFPSTLQPIIQQGFLEREFQQALRSKLAYRACADRVIIAAGIGETLTKTRAGLKPTVTSPMVPSLNTNLDNGLTPTTWGVEQYTISMNLYAATTDLNVVTEQVGIASQFLQNAYVNGEQAGRSLDELARNALFAAYLGGNTRVTATLSSAGPTISVDDIRGFQVCFVNGVQQSVTSTNPMVVTVGANTYSLISATADATNGSKAPNGVSGTLTFSGNVSVSDGTSGNSVIAASGASIVRPSQRGNTSQLLASDTLTMSCLLDAVAKLRLNAVPEIDGAYNCYLDPVSSRQLFADPDFKQLFQGATSANQVFRNGMTNDFLGLRFVPTTEAFVQSHPSLSGLMIRRPVICGRGALIEGDFAAIGSQDVAPADSIINVVDGIAMVTREAIDRLQQIIAQSWYWIGGFCAPSDTTTNPSTVPTATNAAYKRAVVVEHVG
ncbi:DUF4043 domain-containing protein [Rhodopila sp.]|uniref:DUF4043 domain-containing protein n=1 Tax=Rhodopila sp. TaxID=2480087 RepID=UPI002C92113C|nr:DUF4043 domain-containing protein [Rhodopila sp.]HVZ09332.1 DUF4043 domain-containing protein [Rhodopila sp.]